MFFKPALLLWGAVLFAAVPVGAETISYLGSAGVAGSAALERNAPVNAGFLANPTLPALNFDAAGQNGLEPLELAFRTARAGIVRSPEADQDTLGGPDGYGRTRKVPPTPAQAPEPGAFPLILLGLVAVGFLARRPL
jgi:PEP-CTERM motif-containing protein